MWHGRRGAVSVDESVEAATISFGEQVLARARQHRPTAFQERWWEERILEWAMEDDALKAQLFRFVDVFPMLRSHSQVAQHLQAYFADPGLAFPAVAQWGLDFASENPVAARAVAMAVRRNAQRMARRFIAGATIETMAPELRRLWHQRQGFTVSLLGEVAVSENEAAAYQDRYLSLLESLAGLVQSWPRQPLLEEGPEGPVPRVNLSLKLSSLCPQLDPVDREGTMSVLKKRLRPILRRAREVGAFVYVDMEHHDYKDVILRVFREVLEEAEFADWPDAGIVLQAYLRETDADLGDLIQWVHRRPAPIGVRLVRGAYWDYETVVARLREWPVPVFQHKWETDVSYERLTDLLLGEYPRIRLALGTHNVRSIAHGVALMRQQGLPEGAVEVQMLYGMGDELKEALVALGQRTRVYVPYGDLLPGMGYLVRRLLENTSDQSFVRLGASETRTAEELLRPPLQLRASGLRSEKEISKMTRGDGVTEYRPEPVLDFSQDGPRGAMAAAIEEVRSQLGASYPLTIGGEAVRTSAEFNSVNPARPSEVVGRVASATAAHADRAVRTAAEAFPSWRDTAVEERARYVLRAAEEIRRRRLELAAWEIFEVGKPWREADADVAEAIDFLEYYAREMVSLAEPRLLGDDPGETNEYFYQPRGVVAVIAPWNFPLAILTGMTSAALVSGNVVVMKPAEQSSVIAAKLMEVFEGVGLPSGVLNYLPGPGEEVGEYLVTDPRVSVIAFTGSKEVGTRIYERAARLQPGQRHLKRVIAEMGGKNAIIVDDDADLDDAVLGVLASAFGYQGQKCSACSRVIVAEPVHDRFVSRLVEASRSVRVGSPEDPGVVVGPLIDADAYHKVRGYIEIGRDEARLIFETDVAPLGEGYFVGPTIFGDVPPEARIAQEEIFGPVLAVLKAVDFDEALSLATGVDFALTGGLYSRHPEHIERAKRDFRAGNLYINRKITGAVVGRQPFGGFKMSGVGSKAGGPDYLLQFLEPRTVTENTLRRGFAPERGPQ
ncbi:MAG: L-glutamate gamma-semialdehyde dehydrogenase [Chloroflexi bacterium]|nr:L-glutamate gamma-semialdehyde dehydrogenase [Chloroflexota bacterium]